MWGYSERRVQPLASGLEIHEAVQNASQPPSGQPHDLNTFGRQLIYFPQPWYIESFPLYRSFLQSKTMSMSLSTDDNPPSISI